MTRTGCWLIWGVATIVVGGAWSHGTGATPLQQPTGGVLFTAPKTEAEEMVLALSALPESMRTAAAVYVLKSDGYQKAREGTSGVTCLVSHDRPDTQEPMCWDKEGSETILPVKLDEAAWRAQGESEQTIAAKVAEGFAAGRYRAPRRPGISYMMSEDNFVFNGEKVIKYFPHVMSYAPYLTNADIGSDGQDPSAPWVLNPGSPHAYIIVVTRH